MMEKAITLSKFLDFKKADNITLLDLRGKSSLADYFIIATGKNQKHTVSLAEDLIDEAYKLDFNIKSKEGYKSGDWVLLDLEDIIVHIFTEEMRTHYSLERLWYHATNIDLDIDIST